MRTKSNVFYCLIWILSLSIDLTYGQTCPTILPSSAWVWGGITVTPISCVNRAVTVTNSVASATNVKYVYNYTKLSDTVNAVATTSFTYTQPGRYLIVQIGKNAGRSSFACSEVRVVALTKPTFTPTYCNNATVRINLNTTGLFYTTYQVDWGDGTGSVTMVAGQTTATHTYATSGTYNAVVTGTIDATGCTGVSDAIKITPTGTAPAIPVFSKVEVIDNTTAELTYLGPQSNFQLRQRTLPLPVFTNIVSPVSTSTGTETKVKVTGLNTTINVYGFTFSTTTTCGVTNSTVSSTEVYTMSLQAVSTATNYQNGLAWRPAAGTAQPRQFTIFRDATQLEIVAGNVYSHNDTKAVCAKKHAYQVVAEYGGTRPYTSTSIVREATTQPVTPPSPLVEVLANVKNDNTAIVYVVGTPANTRIKSYLLERADGLVMSSTSSPFIDSTANPSKASACYKISYVDVCDRAAPATKPVCTIHLENRGEQLRWAPDLPFTAKNQQYSIERLDAQGRLRRTYPQSVLTNSWGMDMNDADQEVFYRVRATSATTGANKVAGVSNIVSYYRQMRLSIPNAFTPNGDNNNESFMVQGLFIKSASLSIFTRTGQLLYYTEDYKKGWNGLDTNGQQMPADTYVYVVRATDLKGKIQVVRGSIQILR